MEEQREHRRMNRRNRGTERELQLEQKVNMSINIKLKENITCRLQISPRAGHFGIFREGSRNDLRRGEALSCQRGH